MSIAKKLMTVGGGESTYVEDVFSTYLYEGSGSSAPRTIANDINLADNGGLVWIKSRDAAENNMLYDSERTDSVLYSNSNTNQFTNLVLYNRAVFLDKTNGFEIQGSDATVNGYNKGYVSWTFRKQPGFFDVVKYTGNGSPGVPRTLSHNLGSVPGMIIVKSITQSANWAVYHRAVDSSSPEEYNLYLDTTNPRNATDLFGHTAPTDTEFTVGWDSDVNSNGQEYIAYLFAHDTQEFGADSDESIIKCGSFPGRYSTIDLGFEPQWVLIKPATGDGPWSILDTLRGWPAEGSGGANPLRANETSAEITGDTSLGYITSTGFYVDNVGVGDFIYMAIRRPNKPAEEFEPEELFDVVPRRAQGSAPYGSVPRYETGFVTDMIIQRKVDVARDCGIQSRLTGTKSGYTNTTNADYNNDLGADLSWDHMTGVWSATSSADSTDFGWGWRRAPGFFDAVAYGGTSSSGHQVPHNLGVVPEMMWIKRRDFDNGGMNWFVYHKELEPTRFLYLNEFNGYSAADTSALDATRPTDTHFTVGASPYTNYTESSGGAHIAYLFASLPGVSKVDSYIGNGSNDGPVVECGFVPRFLLVKNFDGNGNWTVADYQRDLGSWPPDGGYPQILNLNNTNAQGPDSFFELTDSGFQIRNGSGNVNTNGSRYLFYAIA